MGEKHTKDSEQDQAETLIKRPIDPRRVLQILECRRKTMSYVESMLEPEISTETLRSGEDLICQRDYDGIVQERYISKICGYPLCSNKLTKVWKQKYHLSLRDKKVYDVEVRKLFCSVKCMDTSTKYRNECVPEQPVWMRPDDLEQLERHQRNQEVESANLRTTS